MQFVAVPESSLTVFTTRFGAVTVMPLEVIVRMFTGSVAVMVCTPGVANVAGNVPAPLIRVVGEGSVALGSVLENVIVPE